ncbi:MAG: type II secretion system protein GspE, partial [Desulfurobacterium sp.]
MRDKADELRLKEFVAERLGIALELIKEEDNWQRKLIDRKIVPEEKLLSILSEFFGVPPVDLREVEIPPELIKIVPRSTAEKAVVVPFDRKGPTLKLAMADPSDVQTRERIRFTTGYRIQPFVALDFRIKEKLEEIYGKAEEEFFSRLKKELQRESSLTGLEGIEDITYSAQVVSL